jgi:3D (Asp-Asp-Asp) domain-containing protein
MRAIAVSPDLVSLGLRRGVHVRIAGLPGEWKVLDRMPSRWTRRIDLYMGRDVRAARDFGKREVRITWAGS